MGIEDEPGLAEQTRELGATLKRIMDDDPAGVPSDAAAAVFAGWLAVAGPASSQPRHFADVAANYEVQANSNKDLFELFGFLEAYLDFEEDLEPEPRGTFIGLPMIG